MTGAAEISGAKRTDLFTKGGQYDRAARDFYTDPAWCTERLLDEEDFPEPVWDCAAGSGTIPITVGQHSHKRAYASDIIARPDMPRFLIYKHNFLSDDKLPAGVGWLSQPRSIITNPPYAQAQLFVSKALAMDGIEKVAMLVQGKFLWSQTRHALFSEHPPVRCYILSTRPSMPPGDALLAGNVPLNKKGEPFGGKVDYLWMVWDRNVIGGHTLVTWLKR